MVNCDKSLGEAEAVIRCVLRSLFTVQIRTLQNQCIEPQSGQGAENNPETTSFRGCGPTSRACTGRRGRAKKEKTSVCLSLPGTSRRTGVSWIEEQGRWMFSGAGNGWQVVAGGGRQRWAKGQSGLRLRDRSTLKRIGFSLSHWATDTPGTCSVEGKKLWIPEKRGTA